ncbi:MAG: hypothetical protein DRJ10_12155, partial [Bacteroidetes bacterium]
MRIKYYLKEKDSNSETNIILRASYKGKRLRYYPGIKVHPKHWNEDSEYIYSTGKHSTLNNALLRNIRTEVELEYRKQISKGHIPEPKYFTDYLDKKFKAKYKKSDSDIFMLFDELIESKKKTCSTSTIEKYNFLRNQLKEI